jgi:hypothetical protein
MCSRDCRFSLRSKRLPKSLGTVGSFHSPASSVGTLPKAFQTNTTCSFGFFVPPGAASILLEQDILAVLLYKKWSQGFIFSFQNQSPEDFSDLVIHPDHILYLPQVGQSYSI